MVISGLSPRNRWILSWSPADCNTVFDWFGGYLILSVTSWQAVSLVRKSLSKVRVGLWLSVVMRLPASDRIGRIKTHFISSMSDAKVQCCCCQIFVFTIVHFNWYPKDYQIVDLSALQLLLQQAHDPQYTPPKNLLVLNESLQFNMDGTNKPMGETADGVLAPIVSHGRGGVWIVWTDSVVFFISIPVAWFRFIILRSSMELLARMRAANCTQLQDREIYVLMILRMYHIPLCPLMPLLP